MRLLRSPRGRASPHVPALPAPWARPRLCLSRGPDTCAVGSPHALWALLLGRGPVHVPSARRNSPRRCGQRWVVPCATPDPAEGSLRASPGPGSQPPPGAAGFLPEAPADAPRGHGSVRVHKASHGLTPPRVPRTTGYGGCAGSWLRAARGTAERGSVGGPRHVGGRSP